jgi:hypothetical protein
MLLRVRTLNQQWRSRAVLGSALLTAAGVCAGLAIGTALAEELQSSEPPAPVLVEQAGPLVGEAPVQVNEIVIRWEESPTQAAGGQDDAQRASERSSEQHQNDDGDRRRK